MSAESSWRRWESAAWSLGLWATFFAARDEAKKRRDKTKRMRTIFTDKKRGCYH
jgi:hypothetical protein